jgi:cupin superfamily acireductone dioxygenase involved in methionine salvage
MTTETITFNATSLGFSYINYEGKTKKHYVKCTYDFYKTISGQEVLEICAKFCFDFLCKKEERGYVNSGYLNCEFIIINKEHPRFEEVYSVYLKNQEHKKKSLQKNLRSIAKMFGGEAICIG